MYQEVTTVLFNQHETAAYLHTTVKSLNAMRHRGTNTLPYLRWGNRIKYRKADLDAWIESNLQNKGEENAK